MQLNLRDAARMLGWSDRQVRYAIKQGRISARKTDGRWVVDADALPLTDGQKRARERKVDELRGRVESALAPRPPGNGYSVRSLTAFSAATRLARECAAHLGDGHPGARALGEATVALARGCHRFGEAKLQAWHTARDTAASAVAHLHIAGDDAALALADRVEADLLPALVGLARRQEAPRRRRAPHDGRPDAVEAR